MLTSKPPIRRANLREGTPFLCGPGECVGGLTGHHSGEVRQGRRMGDPIRHRMTNERIQTMQNFEHFGQGVAGLIDAYYAGRITQLDDLLHQIEQHASDSGIQAEWVKTW